MARPTQRRKIREAVVQILYAIDSIPAATTHEEALDLVMESTRTRVLQARCKAILHLQQGREKALGPLTEIVREIGKLDHALREEDAVRAIRDLAHAEEKVNTAMTSLRLELGGNKNPDRLSDLLDEALRANQESRNHLARLTTPRTSLPAIEGTRSVAVGVSAPLLRYAERLAQCLSPDPPELPEFGKIRKALAAGATFRDEVDALATGVLASLTALDTSLAESVDNYSPARIDRVDRAILRLGTYELTCCPDLPTPVILNEAIEIARAFGTTDSPAFVNGVLDRVARERPASQAGGNL